MSHYHYVVSAHKPTAVTNAVTGSFTGKDDLNLIVSKFNRIEISTITPEGLRTQLEVGIYGRIACLQLFRPTGRETDLLFVSTERYQFAVLSYDAEKSQIVTEAAGTTRNDTGRPTPSGQISVVDPDCRMVFVHQYMGMIKIIPMDKKGQVQESFNVRLEDLHVISIQCLHNCAKPTIVVLFQDAKDARHLKTYEVQLNDKSLGEGPWSLPNIAGDATMLIPVPKPCGGVIVVGSQSITYRSSTSTHSIAMPVNEMVAYGQIDADGKRFLLGDYEGGLHILFLTHVNNVVSDIKLQRLGETSRASALCYLDNGVVYVGSRLADSQLVRLNTEPDERGSVVELLDSYTNLGPIVDFCVVDLERQGQGQVVTCSGINKDGSLRIVRNGVGINEQATLDFSGIKGFWALRPTTDAKMDTMLAVSFIGETRFLAFVGDELEETEIDGFLTDRQTFYCGNVINNLMVQVTDLGVRLVSCETRELVHEWAPPTGIKVSLATCNTLQILVATGGGNLVYIEVDGNRLVERRHKQLPSEISCINANPVHSSSGHDNVASLCAVGLWGDMSVRLLRLTDLEEVAQETMGGDYIPRSVLIAPFETVTYLLVALGDGQLHSFILDPVSGALSDRKKLSLGTQPVTLNTFRSKQATHVFAASDRPTVIYASNGKLLFSNVNVKEVNFMSALNSQAFPESLAIANDNGLIIGTIDDIQKLHIRTVPLGETPRRIAHQDSSLTFAVITLAQHISANEEVDTSHVRLIDDQTYEVLDTFNFDENEQGASVVSLTFADDQRSYFAVGSAYVIPSEDYPTRGRIRILQVSENRLLKQVAEKEVKGGVFALEPLNGKLVAAIDSKVNVYKWNETSSGNRELVSECGHHSHTMALHLKTRGDFILVGDLLKSVSLLRYGAEGSIEEIARDFNANWTCAIDILDDETFIGSENEYNLFVLRKNSEAVTHEEGRKLETAGLFHFGDSINKFRRGSLVMRLPEHESSIVPTLLFGSVSGVLGVVATLPQDKYTFLRRVQDNLSRIIRGVGGFEHSEWRTFHNEHRTTDSFNFLDGDLIELFLDLSRDNMEAVIRGDNGGQIISDCTVEDLTKTIEELARLH